MLEVFPRADGTTYVCASSTETPLPPDAGAVDRLLDLCLRISPALHRSRLLRTGACFRPMARDGLPLIGAVPGAPGADAAGAAGRRGRRRVTRGAADPGHGASVFGTCSACPTVGRGGADVDGPNLYGVVGSRVAGRRPRYGYT